MAAAPADLSTAAQRVVAAASPSVVRIGRHGGRGNGVVIGDGLVLTNAHNLRDRTTEVTFADGRAEQASALGADIDGDLVVLAVTTGDAPAVRWADGLPEPGALVIAVAQARGGGTRVTTGMVSSTGRSFRGPGGRPAGPSLEHTAPLARGSSGSPILDLEGRVVGLSTARLGDGFYAAVPADEAFRTRVDALARGESPQRRSLGIGVAPSRVARRMRAQVGLPERDGLLVRSVDPAGPAGRAGIEPGDLIVAAGGGPVVEVDELHAALGALDEGAALVLGIVRGVDELEVAVGFDDDAPTDEGTA